ncbi:MAG: signal peptidase I [Myxococcaceae bacterium]
MASTPNALQKLEAEVAGRRSAEQKSRARRLWWTEALTSLWAPVTVFGLAFTFYLFVVESLTCSYLWLQPVLKGFGFLMVVWFAALAVYRSVLPGPRRLRKLRHEAHDLTREIEALLHKHQAKVDPKVREKLVDQAAQVDAERLNGTAAKLEAQLGKLSELADKHLSAWRKGSALDFVSGFAKALAVALLIRAVLIEPFKIPSGSMIPTLEIGDQIFVNKFIYGVRLPWMNVVPFQIVREPRRGDVIVFNNPVDTDKDFVKRVVGVPGDTIELIDKVIYVNGQPQPAQVENPDYVFYDQDQTTTVWERKEATLFREVLSGQPHLALRAKGDPSAHEGPYLVPPKNVFVMGDNRDNSYDSRYALGKLELCFPDPKCVKFVPYGNIKGKAMVIWLALGYGGLGSSFFGGTGLRTDRLFEPVRMCGAEPPRSH